MSLEPMEDRSDGRRPMGWGVKRWWQQKRISIVAQISHFLKKSPEAYRNIIICFTSAYGTTVIAVFFLCD